MALVFPKMSGFETSVSPTTAPARILSLLASGERWGERLGAQNPATRGPDEFHSNRSIGAGRSLVPGPRNLLASAWIPGSDPSAGVAQADPARSPQGFPINGLFPPGGETSPQRELRGPTFSAEI